ncbi:MAG TPA: PilX N-terminal domain-containing pilus assembly protein [Candidatus Sulfotelmatobacter sp.]|nr:PilX N-terminal domain-containing pilus assembly protein [Candidatus Sulfotelmatobacter sp.]
MAHGKHSSRGFTLIAALLVLVLLSGVAVGLLFMVSNESRMSGNGLENDQAFYAAESGMEKLTADLSALYTAYMVPSNAQIQNLSTNPPSPSMVGNVTYNEAITYATNAQGNPLASWNTISAGSNQGLYAEIVPMTLSVNALRPEGAFVNMTRQVEIALIPVFQFGVFCGYDCSYFAGPNFGFAGRVHTNGNLFLAAGADLVFTDKVGAFQQIITDRLENGWSTGAGYGGTIYASTTASGCVLGMPPVFPPPTGANCKTLPGAATIPGDASWSGGYPTIAGAANGLFPGISSGTFNGYLANSTTGVTNLQLPFVQNSCTSNPPPCTDPIQIIRKPQPGESPTSALGSSRMYNKAQIRILLADTQLELHPERGLVGDGQDVQFTTAAGAATSAAINPGVNLFNTGGGLVAGPMPYAMAQVGVNSWIAPSGYPGWTKYPLLGELTTAGLPANGMGAWIRVEYLNNANPPVWVGITTDWLGYGFTRQYNQAPTGPAGTGPTATKPGADPYDPDAILILQQMAPGAASPVTVNGAYPINFYDAREGEMRDNANGCAVNGIMNAVELNVGNLGLWLAGKAPYAGDVGTTVNYLQDNGYILYYSDHRGLLPDPNPTNGGGIAGGVITGESGLEDVVNSGQPLTSTTPNGTLEPATYYGYSPEDVDQNGFLDNWGGKNIGYGFGVNTNTAPPNPYLTIPGCATTGLANMVSGGRHVLKLVAGGMSAAGVSYLPILPPAAACAFTLTTDCGGFTVASENPVYVQGDYNSGAVDTFWGGGSNNAIHSAASIVADSVTLLSNIDKWPTPANGWTDLNSLQNPTTLNSRPATTTYYRMAVSGGKNIPFPQPGFGGVANDFGTDGGLHNFLRLLENWGNGSVLNYNGSLVNMYYSEYNTGTFKCCTVVYGAPRRDFYFDTLFLNPNNLPPGTPMFQDIVNLSYHQNYTPQ